MSSQSANILDQTIDRARPAVANIMEENLGTSQDTAANAEDALPSMLTPRAAALGAQTTSIAANSTTVFASYYQDWAVDVVPPENLDYSRFDILFLGE